MPGKTFDQTTKIAQYLKQHPSCKLALVFTSQSSLLKMVEALWLFHKINVYELDNVKLSVL